MDTTRSAMGPMPAYAFTPRTSIAKKVEDDGLTMVFSRLRSKVIELTESRKWRLLRLGGENLSLTDTSRQLRLKYSCGRIWS